MQNQGWLKIHRKMLGWEWYDDIKTKVLFIHLLLVCNFKQTKWRGVELEEGETIKSIETLSKETTLSVRSIRTSINKLKTTGELTERWHGKYRILKLKNYKQYQINDMDIDNSATRQRQDSDIKTTADKERKEIKKEKKVKKILGEKISPTPSEIAKKFFEDIPNKQYSPWADGFINNGWPEKELIDNLQAFWSYWTEPSKNGKKQRWQMQPTFEIKRRLITWMSRASNGGFSGKKKGLVIVS